MNQKHTLIKGAAILTAAGMASRIIGFFYRIFLSKTIGAEGVGIYLLILPVHALIFSLTGSGIQTAVSRFVSSRSATGDRKGAKEILVCALSLSMLLSMAASCFLYLKADYIASVLLHESRCALLLKVLCFSIPFGSIHACIIGYYTGLKRTDVPAISQLFEQVVRVASSFLIYQIMVEKNLTVSPVLAVYGTVCSEIASVLYTGTKVMLHHRTEQTKLSSFPFHCVSEILTFSIPLMINRVLINLLQSAEAVCIPLKLLDHGFTQAAALSTYGTLTGMALPLVLFPSAITNSLAVMLLPTVSEAQASGNKTAIERLTRKTTKSCLLLGFFCTIVFLLTGNFCGTFLFDSREAAVYIQILAWLCPFLYLGTTLGSILNGLGKTFDVFLINAAALLLRILFVWFAIPSCGILGYLWGLLLSQLLQSVLLLFRCRQISFF